MSVELFRVDDRLIHGQVIVGWGRPLQIDFIALVDDAVASSEWEQEVYRLAVPPRVDLYFDSVESAVRRLPDYLADTRHGLVLTGTVAAMRTLAERTGRVEHVNIGGLHHAAGRAERLPYVFLSPDEERQLCALQESGADVTAQDLPGSHPVALTTLLAAKASPGAQ
jgi:PTS system mannose-specific IIB component/fructoselysine and glucoselysine-specific PTS system IIB component